MKENKTTVVIAQPPAMCVEGMDIYVLKEVGFLNSAWSFNVMNLSLKVKLPCLVTINILACAVAVTRVPVASNDGLCGRCDRRCWNTSLCIPNIFL